MARYTKESLEELKGKIDLSEVISAHIQLKKSGSAYKALCPFHEERSPSFTLQKGDTHYHCFGCGAHGDAISFLMQHLRFGFQEAVTSLAERFNVHLETVAGDKKEDGDNVSRAKIREALEFATSFYHYYLFHTEEGKVPLQYLYERGLTIQFLSQFRIGLAPKDNNLLYRALKSKGFADDVLEAAGLMVYRGGRLREFFQERITFPIQDQVGAIIGFSARKFLEDTYGGKYINTHETPLFKKSKVLFGLSNSRHRIIKEKQAIIVEGQLDALRLIFNGFDYTVAALGTAFGEGHVKILEQLGVQKVYILFDGDQAGRIAAVKVGQLFQKDGIEVKVCSLASGMDPDLLLLKNGPSHIFRELTKAEDYLHFIYYNLSDGIDLSSPAVKNQHVSEIVKLIREWDNPIMIHDSLKSLAHLAQVPEDLLGIGTKTTSMFSFKQESIFGKSVVDPDLILESDLLRWLLIHGSTMPRLVEIAKMNITSSSLRLEIAKKIYDLFMQKQESGIPFDLLSLNSELDGNDLGNFLSEILGKKVNKDRGEGHLIETIKRIKERNWMIECEEAKIKIHSGKASDVEINELVKKFDILKKNPPKVLLPELV